MTPVLILYFNCQIWRITSCLDSWSWNIYSVLYWMWFKKSISEINRYIIDTFAIYCDIKLIYRKFGNIIKIYNKCSDIINIYTIYNDFIEIYSKQDKSLCSLKISLFFLYLRQIENIFTHVKQNSWYFFKKFLNSKTKS